MMATHALDGRFLRIQNVASNAKRVRIEGQCLDPTSLTAPPLHTWPQRRNIKPDCIFFTLCLFLL
jgi:hypothetical protein